jgi:hypothetical protein
LQLQLLAPDTGIHRHLQYACPHPNGFRVLGYFRAHTGRPLLSNSEHIGRRFKTEIFKD